jgi:ribosomal protein L40E
MTTFDADFDYLLLLGIDPAEALRAPASLAEPIKAKKKEWTGQALNPLYQQSARSNLERARQFEALLAEPAALAAYVSHIRQARAALRGEHETALALLIALARGGKTSLTTRQRDLIAKEAKAEGIAEPLLGEVLKSRSIAVTSPRAAAAAAAKPKLPLQSPSLDSTVMADIQNWLKVLDKRSLYELLDLPLNTQPPRLVSQAQLLYFHWSKVLPKTTTSTAWEKTLQASLTYLKDADTKAKYDRSLFNQRVQRLVSRIDLVLAGDGFGPDEQAQLTRLGVEDLGFTEAVVEKCIAARMAELGITAAMPASITIHVQALVRCRRCGAWNGPKLMHCRECGSSLRKKCENPSCDAGPIPDEAKVCPSCGLAAARGGQYRTLLRLADAFLESGSHQAAISVCQRAAQIHPGPAIEQRLARSARVRDVIASAKLHAAAEAWSAVRADWKELLPLAPRIVLQGVPSLEKIAAFLVEIQQKLRAIPAEAGPIESAKIYLACLKRWSDCEEAHQKLQTVCTRLEAEGNPKLAAQVAARLLELRPEDAALKAYLQRLEPEVKRSEAQAAERQNAVNDYLRAIKENRLYAAELSLQTIEATPARDPGPPAADELRRRLADTRRELVEIKQLVAGPTRRELVIGRYLEILGRCRDCREALLALQTLPLDPPPPPEGLAVRREGNRRLLSWKAPSASKRYTYVVQRSITRPGSRQVDPPFQTIYEGDALHVNDDEVAHGGVILRYMVHTLDRGRIEVDGTVVRTYEMTSPPACFPGVLIHQEVMNLKPMRRDRSLEISWYLPTGARQVLIERWPGGPDDHGLGIAILPATSENRLVDEGLGDRMVHTYRISCVYDGPDGEFRTPGVCLTDGVVAGAARPSNEESAQGVPVPLSNGS